MKFQICTYQRLSGTANVVDPYVAFCLGHPFRLHLTEYCGATREEAQSKLVADIQERLDHYTDLRVTEVEITPKKPLIRETVTIGGLEV